MATSTVSSLLLPAKVLNDRSGKLILPKRNSSFSNSKSTRVSFRVQAAKLPSGVVVPKAEPKFKPAFLGFTKVAETWNSRACMIGLIGTFIVELIVGKGILQMIGLEIGKGLDIPL